MTLLDKSLKSALLASSVLALSGSGCFTTDDNKGDDSGTDAADADADADGDADADADADDTGIAYLFHVGRGGATEGVWTPGSYGAGWYGVGVTDWVCSVLGTWSATETVPVEGCPDCEWSFNLAVTDSLEDGGPECDDLRAAGLTDGAFDDPTSYFNTDWGFTNAFDFYGDGSIIVEESLLFTYEGTWYAFAFNAVDYNIDMLAGDPTAFSFVRSWAADTAGNQFYYYYYL